VVVIDWVRDINILSIITSAPEVHNGAPGSINRNYKCGHMKAGEGNPQAREEEVNCLY